MSTLLDTKQNGPRDGRGRSGTGRVCYRGPMTNSPGYMGLAERRASGIALATSRLNADTSRAPWFTNVLVGFAFELGRAFYELHTGVSEQILCRTALGCRNLLELRYWTMYAAKSEANIWRLRKEALIDVRDTLDKLGAACASNVNLASALPAVQQLGVWFDERCRQTGEAADGTYIRVSNLARELGFDQEHRALNSFLSKLIHPTGLSICLPGVEGLEWSQFYGIGCAYFNDSFERLNDLLKTLSLPDLE